MQPFLGKGGGGGGSDLCALFGSVHAVGKAFFNTDYADKSKYNQHAIYDFMCKMLMKITLNTIMIAIQRKVCIQYLPYKTFGKFVLDLDCVIFFFEHILFEYRYQNKRII